MKGFMIYETPLWGDEENVVYLQEVKDASYTLKQIGSDNITCYLEGIATKDPVTKAKCNEEDTYDFEVGALIALMKMCGVEKVKKAAKETFFDVAENAVNEYEEEIKKLEKEIKRLNNVTEGFYKFNSRLIDEIDQKNHEIISLKALKLTNESLKEENEKLQHEYDLCKNSENALKCSVDYLNKTIAKLNLAIEGYKEDLNKVAKRCRELEAKEDILNKQEETINKREEEMSVYFGGRGCGKQYKALVSLFKKLDQKKVDTAYKEAYNTTLPVWQKEALKQMYDIHKKTKEWLYKIPTKREEMWNDILACDCEHSKYVKVKKEDLEMFAKECNEKKIFNIIGCEFHLQEFWFGDDACIFQIFRKPAGFLCAERLCYVFKDTIIDYLPPMRWDLFKKGRIVVGVKNNYELGDFRKQVERNTGIKDIPMCPTNFCLFYSFDKDNYKIILETIEQTNIAKINGHKVIYWEDVR